MKGKKKIVLPLLLAGVTATAGYVAPVTQAVATVSATTTTSDTENTKVVGEKITVTNFQDTYSIGEIVYMPQVAVTNHAGVEYKVTKSGVKVQLSEVTSDNQSEHSGHSVGDKYFKADYEGYYTIEVSTVGDNQVKTVIDKLSVYVNKTDASIVLPVNSKYVIPAKLQKDETNLVIPAPSVLIGDNEEPTAYKDLEGNQKLKVFIYTPSTKYDEGIELNYNSEKDGFEVKTYTKDTETKNILSETGTYTIVYKYYEGGSVVSTLDSNFQVVNTYDTSKIKLTMTLQDSMPTSGNINEEVSVPKVKVTESSTSLDAINAHITVEVVNQTTGTEVKDFDYENYTFTPTEEGNYLVSYKADVNVFGLESQKITVGTPIKVSDKKSSTVMVAYDYVVDATDANKIISVGGTTVDDDHKLEDLMVSAEHSIPSVLLLKTHTDATTGDTSKYVEINVPAIYGTDNYDKLSELTFTREYRDKHGNVTKIDPNYDKITTDTENTLNKSQTVKLTESGTYEFRFYSQDRAGNTKGYAEYTVVVYDEGTEELEDGTASVELNIPYTYVSDKDEYLTFDAPTATDTYDKYIKVVTEYKLKKGDTVITTKTLSDKDKNSSGKYSINIKELFDNNETKDATSIEVTAKAYIDGSLVDTRDDFKSIKVESTMEDGFIVLTNTKTIKLINSGADEYKTPAELSVVNDDWNKALVEANKDNNDLDGMVGYSSSTSGYTINDKGFAKIGDNIVTLEGSDVKQSPFNQGAGIINLPTIEFKDADDNLSITVVIKNAYGNTVTPVSNAMVERSKDVDGSGKYTYTVSGASFELSNYGIYTVTYTAKNVGGSITTQTFGIRVNDKTKPTIVVDDEDKFDDAIEVGEKFVVPVAKLIKDGKSIDAQSITWEIVDATATYTKDGEIGFTPLEEGTFRVVYHAVDVNGNDADLNIDSYILSAKDTIAPTLKLNDVFIGTWSWDDDDTEKTIVIPNANANDPHNGEVAVKISVSGPNSQTPTIVYEKDDDGNNLYSGSLSFVAKAQGTYTIKYTATDKAGNTTTETKELKLGDCEAPELTWNDEENDIPTEAKLNEKFTVDLSNIKLTDNKTEESVLLDKLSVSLVDPNGSTVTDEGTTSHPSWNITSTGTYTLKFVVKDEAGNSETYSYKVEVPTEDVDDEKISPVVGTILVVVAVVVLAGVVVYFVVSSKKKTPASSKKTRKTNK